MREARLGLVLAGSLAFGAACRSEPATPSPSQEGATTATTATAPLDLEDPETCAGCHQEVAREWNESMHARAHHEKDPIYGRMRALRMKLQGAHLAEKCASCHNPVAPSEPDSLAGRAGVACLACHATERVERGKMGAAALVRSEPMVLRGPHDLGPGASVVHGTGAAAPHLTDGETICLACHAATKNPKGVAACTTGPEYARREDAKTCVECHMPTVEGPSGSVSTREQHRSHAFLGPHRAWLQDDPSFLASGVEMRAELVAGRLKVTLTNRSQHGFPSGFPGRQVILQVTAFDADGDPVEVDEPIRVMGKVYVDAKGKPTLPPFAEKLARDTRLDTDETRTLTFAVGRRAARAKIELLYRLGPPPLFEKLELTQAPEAQPTRVLGLTVERS